MDKVTKTFNIYIGASSETEDQFENMIDAITLLVSKEGDAGGWYVGDCLEITVSVEYRPENK